MKKQFFLPLFILVLCFPCATLNAQTSGMDGFLVYDNFLNADGRSAKVSWRLMNTADCVLLYGSDENMGNYLSVQVVPVFIEKDNLSFYEYGVELADIDNNTFYRIECGNDHAKVESSVKKLRIRTSDLIIGEKQNHIVRDNAAAIFWDTNLPADCMIDYSEDASFQNSKSFFHEGRVSSNEYSGKYDHQAVIMNLEDNTKYYFQLFCFTEDEMVISSIMPIKAQGAELFASSDVEKQYDLAIVDLQASGDRPGEIIEISLTIKNLGDDIYSSRGIIGTYAGLLEEYFGHNAYVINAEKSREWPQENSPLKKNEEIKLEWGMVFEDPGERVMTVVIDYNNELLETDEDNNAAVKSIFIKDILTTYSSRNGFGISPPFLKNDKPVFPGANYEQEIWLLRSSADTDLTAHLSLDAPGIADWISIDGGNIVPMPKNRLQIPFSVNVEVPKNAGIGKYNGYININIVSEEGPLNEMISLAARVDIDLEVSRQPENDRADILKLTDPADFTSKATSIDNIEMYKRLKGGILLRVEGAGEAYYVNAQRNTLHYLGSPADAFQTMREQSVGIRNSDLAKIPIGLSALTGPDKDGDALPDLLEEALGTDPDKPDTDGDGYNDRQEIENGYDPLGQGRLNYDPGFVQKNKGRIFLQVEGLGEAWYLSPSDEKRYFLGRPADAFQVMRRLGLGVSNEDFDSL
jgi:hypothetical protein